MDDPVRIASAEAGESDAPPLIVDLDGSLVHSDTTAEALLVLARRPLDLARVLASWPQGRALVKQRLAALVRLDVASLPYNEPVLAYLREQREKGRRLILATGADWATAEAVARHLGLFDAVLASDGQVNLTGSAKLAAIEKTLGGEPFAYVGNSAKDLLVWSRAAGAICVNARPAVVRETARLTAVEQVFPPERAGPLLLRAMRPHQWAKNLLVFVPLVAAHAIGDMRAWAAAIMVFSAFCCTASGIYLLNDLSDLAADRGHPRKARRPFASGALPLHIGMIAAPLLLLAGFGLSFAVGALTVIFTYAVLSCIYSLWLKSRALVDVFVLAALYGLRLMGGGVATGYHVSLWLLAFSSFLFLGLAMVKRVAELMALPPGAASEVAGRGYRASDLPILQLMGVAASFVASLVLALYVQSELASAVDRGLTPSWIIVPLVLFWECRMWLATARGEMHDDPVVFAARDWGSWLVVACCFALLLLDRLVGT